MQGLAFLVTFGAMPKVTGPARPCSALVADEPVLRRTTLVGINLWWVKTHPCILRTVVDSVRYKKRRELEPTLRI